MVGKTGLDQITTVIGFLLCLNCIVLWNLDMWQVVPKCPNEGVLFRVFGFGLLLSAVKEELFTIMLGWFRKLLGIRQNKNGDA